MAERAEQLHSTANGQIEQLIGLLSSIDQATLRLPCPGRQKLGDGTVGALVSHTADNYQRIAGFVQTSEGAPGAGQHGHGHSADNIDPTAVITQLSAARDALGRLAELTNGQLDAVPPKDSFRFCDGQRTLHQVLASLLKHQAHQLDSIQTTVALGGCDRDRADPRPSREPEPEPQAQP